MQRTAPTAKLLALQERARCRLDHRSALRWSTSLTDRDCPTLGRALELGEKFFDTPRDGWVLAPREVEPWREPVAKDFENRRDVLLDLLRSALAADVE
jgi:hypothetical protein